MSFLAYCQSAISVDKLQLQCSEYLAQMLTFGKILDQYIGFFLYWGGIQKEADTCILIIGLAKFHVKDLEN